MKKSELKQLIKEEILRENQTLSDGEILKLLMEIWERIPLGSRMNEGGMPRTIPLQIRNLLNKKGYTITKITSENLSESQQLQNLEKQAKDFVAKFGKVKVKI